MELGGGSSESFLRATNQSRLTIPPEDAGRPTAPTNIHGGQTGSISNTSAALGARDLSAASRTSQRPNATPTAYESSCSAPSRASGASGSAPKYGRHRPPAGATRESNSAIISSMSRG